MIARSIRRQITGTVDRCSGNKTIRITVQTLKRHKLLSKVYKVTKRYLVHDEKNEASVGDQIIAMSCKPLSKNKQFRLVNILNKKEKVTGK